MSALSFTPGSGIGLSDESGVTATDLFCGGGGSSLGAEGTGKVRIEIAANHWSTAVEVHQTHFPHARHDVADISQADPRRYPRTDILMASPECTNHSQARGVSRKRQDPSLWDAPDPSAERSRSTMWDVGRFAEQLHYDAIVVENVVEATRWTGWTHWLGWLTSLGYQHQVLSHNSMHHGVPQSRDRIYVVFWRKGLRPNLELQLDCWCPRCEAWRPSRQAWKSGRSVGRYGQQWNWACTTCGREAWPLVEAAAKIIDWALPITRIGDRAKPLAQKTRERIYAGLVRHGWVPIATSGAGHVYETTPGNRARPLTGPLPVQHATATTAVATPPGFLFQPAHGGRSLPLTAPHPTVTASDDRHALVVPLRAHGNAYPTTEPLGTIAANGLHHGLLVRSNGFEGSGDLGRFTSTTDAPLPTVVTTQRPGLLMRNNGGGAEMVTPLDEPARTVTTKGHQSLLVPYNRTGHARTVGEPMATVTTHDRLALLDPDQVIDDCGFRMLEPHEIAAAMAFPDGYFPTTLTKRDRVKLAGNAVTPPVMAWIMGRLVQALEAAS